MGTRFSSRKPRPHGLLSLLYAQDFSVLQVKLNFTVLRQSSKYIFSDRMSAHYVLPIASVDNFYRKTAPKCNCFSTPDDDSFGNQKTDNTVLILYMEYSL